MSSVANHMPTIDARYLFGGLLGIPALMGITKMYRIDARDRHEVYMDIKYRATFWEKANRFTDTLNEAIWQSVAGERPRGETGNTP